MARKPFISAANMEDTINIMVVGRRAKTRTGRKIALSAATAFEHPELGRFASFLGFMALERRRSMDEPVTRAVEKDYRSAIGEKAEMLFNASLSNRHKESVLELADLYLGHLVTLATCPENGAQFLERFLTDCLIGEEFLNTASVLPNVIVTIKKIRDDEVEPDYYQYVDISEWEARAIARFLSRFGKVSHGG